MEKQFVPYELAVKLKELGFNEPVIATYTQNCYGGDNRKIQYFVDFVEQVNQDAVFISAPLWQQVFDWFRAEHNLPNWIYESVGRWYFRIVKGDFWIEHKEIGHFKTYEEARLACLERLIKLEENK